MPRATARRSLVVAAAEHAAEQTAAADAAEHRALFARSRRAAAPPRTRATARRENGRLCSQTVPGPVTLAKNRPSPPNSAVLILPTYWISKLTFGV